MMCVQSCVCVLIVSGCTLPLLLLPPGVGAGLTLPSGPRLFQCRPVMPRFPPAPLCCCRPRHEGVSHCGARRCKHQFPTAACGSTRSAIVHCKFPLICMNTSEWRAHRPFTYSVSVIGTTAACAITCTKRSLSRQSAIVSQGTPGFRVW